MIRTIEWEGCVRLAFDEIRLAGTTSPQVTRRLVAALEDLETVALPDRRPAIDRQLVLLESAVRRAYPDEADIAAALTPRSAGHRIGRDLAYSGRLPDKSAGFPAFGPHD